MSDEGLPGGLRHRVRPWFLTPRRRSWVGAVMEGLGRGAAASIALPDEPRRAIAGLPYEVGYVLEHREARIRVGWWWARQEGLGERGLHTLAVHNLWSEGLLRAFDRYPDQGAPVVIDDPLGYAASAALLLPDVLSEGEAVIAFSLRPEQLVIFPDDEPDLDLLLRELRQGGFDFDVAPIPEPVRVSRRGFESLVPPRDALRETARDRAPGDLSDTPSPR